MIRGCYFITSEKCHDSDPRRYSVRRAMPDGTIETVGEFCGYLTREAARAAVKSEVTK